MVNKYISIVILLALLVSFIPITVGASGVPIETIKDRVVKAYSYIIALKRDMGTYGVISEYPSIPIIVKASDDSIFWIPGLKYYVSSDDYYYVEIHDQTIEEGYYGTFYRWYMDLKYSWYSGDVGTDEVWATLKITEYRGYPYSYLRIEVTYVAGYVSSIMSNCEIYFAGSKVGNVIQGNTYTISPLSDSPIPSMRTSVRHVDVIGALILANLGDYSESEDIWNLAQAIMFNVFQTDKPLYDIYNSMMQGFDYTGLIEAPNEWHFYDGQWFSYGLGYSKIWEFFESQGWIWTTYPLYPYKSKIVSAAEASHTNGGYLFLSTQALLDDPLLDAWQGLYYAYTGDWGNALNKWNEVASKWDGNGIVFSNQIGYSTVRLAAALALGSVLAGHGLISWDIPDQMASVLVQLQWSGSGYYSPDGNTVFYVVKPDHAGGFLVSYGPIGSYGFVPFRPSLVEDILKKVTDVMPPEYGGILPTNAETTLLSMAALMQYAYNKYGVRPERLLFNIEPDSVYGSGEYSVSFFEGKSYHKVYSYFIEPSTSVSRSVAGAIWKIDMHYTSRDVSFTIHGQFRYYVYVDGEADAQVRVYVYLTDAQGNIIYQRQLYNKYYYPTTSKEESGTIDFSFTKTLSPGEYYLKIEVVATTSAYDGIAIVDVYNSDNYIFVFSVNAQVSS
ncbi:hypothetical protein J4526_01420 [Desulfurococcaceae archaeon MEX13E-LK6-19]|nr:hypothetical protein J4526_01420 [Desulfurococcaceae archaeon MEX13E-LK6-19]